MFNAVAFFIKSPSGRCAKPNARPDIEASLKSIGKWFYLQNFEVVYEWRDNKNNLVNKLLENPVAKTEAEPIRA